MKFPSPPFFSFRLLTAITLSFALSVISNAQTESDTSDPTLVLHYRFDEKPGDNVIKDHSSYQHHGKLTDAEWHPELENRKGVLRFNGTTAYIAVPNYGQLWFDGDATFELWVRQHALQTTGAMLLFGEAPPLVSFILNISQDYAMAFTTYRKEEGEETEPMTYPVTRKFLNDEWAHLAIVVEYPRIRFYRNGRLIRDQFMPNEGINRLGKNELRIAGNPTSKQFSPIDLSEFRIYRRALTAVEIAAHAAGEEQAPKADTEVFTFPNWYTNQMEVRYVLKNAPLPSDHATLMLEPENGKRQTVHAKWNTVSRNGSERHEAKADFDLTGLDGVTASLSIDAGRNVPPASKTLALSIPDWIRAKAGKTATIPTPWEPVKISENNGIDILLRHYKLGNSIFPAQIEAKGAELLAAPIALEAEVDGAAVEWKKSPLKRVKMEDREVSLAQQWQAGPLQVAVASRTEFDGFIIYDCEVTTTRPVKLDGLRLAIPLKAAHASLCYGDKVRPREGRDYTSLYYSGAIREPLEFLFSPNVWIGDRERGLAWQAESNEFWRNTDPQKAIRITPEADTTRFSANFIDKATSLKPGEKRHYRFALLATPVKPLERDGWKLRVARYEPIGTDFELPSRKVGDERAVDKIAELGVRHLYNFISDIFAWPMPVHEAYAKALRNYVETVQSTGVKVHPYAIHQRFPSNVPEFDGYGRHMSKRPLAGSYVQPRAGWPVNTKRPGTPAVDYGADSASSVFMCPKSEPLQDAFLNSLEQRLKIYGESGVYLDGTVHIVPCQNTEHGCGYQTEEGKLEPTFPVFAIREMMRRIYTLVRENCGTEGIVDVHCSFGYNTAALAYADIMWNGEQWHHLRHKGAEYVAGELSLDQFCTEFLGRQIGIAAEILHYRLRNTEKIAATSLLHDISPRYSLGGFDNSTQSVGNYMSMIPRMWKLRDEFGAEDAEKLFYWHNSDYVTVANEQAYVTLLRHPENGTLAFISNLSRENADVRVRFNLQKLGLAEKTVKIVNPLTGEEVALSAEGELLLPLASEDWKYLWLKPNTEPKPTTISHLQ